MLQNVGVINQRGHGEYTIVNLQGIVSGHPTDPLYSYIVYRNGRTVKCGNGSCYFSVDDKEVTGFWVEKFGRTIEYDLDWKVVEER